jgi:hypothetical protein
MSFQASSAVGLATSALRRSPGSLCTTPPGTRGLLTERTVAGQGEPSDQRRTAVRHVRRAAPRSSAGPNDDAKCPGKRIKMGAGSVSQERRRAHSRLQAVLGHGTVR